MSSAGWAALAAGGLAFLLLWRVLFVSWVELRWPRRGRLIKTSGGRLHVFSRGEGPAVLFLHAAGGTAREFAPTAALLGDGFRHVLADRPGHGYSTAAKRALPLAHQAEMLWEALDALGIGAVIVAAHGDGAALALRMALDRPRRVRGLALAAPLAFADALRPVKGLPAGLGTLFRNSLAPLLAPLLGLARLRARFAPVRPSPAFARQAGAALALRPAALASELAQRRRLPAEFGDLAARYREIEAYAIVLTADVDPLADPAANARALYAALPRAELVVSPGVGHMHHAARPEALAAAIRRLAALEASARAR